MEATEEYVVQKEEELLDKIAELDYSQSQLKDLNAEMRQWLDVADEDMQSLRTENGTLKKQIKALEKMITESQQDEPEPNRFFMTEYFDAQKSSESKIHELETESNSVNEQNRKLMAEVKSLERQREQDKITMSKLKVELQNLEVDMEEAQIDLQRSGEIIDQKNQEIQELEDTVQEFSEVIKDLRRSKQELIIQLERRQEEASFAVQTVLMTEREGLISPQLSLAEEIQLIGPLCETKSTMTDPVEFKEEEDESEVEREPPVFFDAPPPIRPLEFVLKTDFLNVGTVLFSFITLFLLGLVILGFAGTFDSFSNILWSSARLMLQPCFSVQYGTLPPF